MFGLNFKDPAVCFQTVDAGFHNHIQYHQVEGMIAHIFDSLFTAGHGRDLITQFFQHFGCNLALFRDIINHQYGFAVSHYLMHGCHFILGGQHFAGHRKIQCNFSPFSFRAGEVDESPMVFHGTPNNRHSKAGSTSAHGLFGVKRLEYTLHILRRNSDTVINDGQSRVIAFIDIVIADFDGIHMPVLSGYANVTSFGHGLGGIGHQIHNRF